MGKARELKFRVWDNENDCFFEPTFEGHRGKIEELMISLSGDLCLRTIDRMIHESMFKDRFVMDQFTGLQDENGVDIYEGDVLEFKNDLGRRHLHKVFWAEGGLVINSHDSDIDKKNIVFYNACADMQTAGWIKQCAVIGNIHENPELLNK